MRDAATGEVLFGGYSGARHRPRHDRRRAAATSAAWRSWASLPGGTDAAGLWSATGEILWAATPGHEHEHPLGGRPDHADRQRQPADLQTPTIDDWTRGTPAHRRRARSTNNGTKGNPSLVADVFGDWREELLVRTADSTRDADLH